ncbi:hypothetical protein DSO57_1034764 [Entomophthora muscae]|uniref:Uncharacterized protein n=1 Tax=Entomophthora muscae TaxID=34485 RepID=A0ACC2SCQ5_9FUNG|nr:hypothetical protein DSO57_1034764 [Entomophthora muscae]
MTDRRKEFIGNEFTRLLKDWYRPTEGLAPTEVQAHGGDARLVIGKGLEEFVVMQAKYKQLQASHLPLLENDNSFQLVSGYDPGHNLLRAACSQALAFMVHGPKGASSLTKHSEATIWVSMMFSSDTGVGMESPPEAEMGLNWAVRINCLSQWIKPYEITVPVS